MSERATQIRRGITEATPLFLPAIPVALVVGLVVSEAGIGAGLGWSTSPAIMGGAAQITLLKLLGEGVSVAAAVTATLIVSARHLLYSLSLAPAFGGQPRWFRWFAPYLLIDQLFALATLRADAEPAAFRVYYLSAGLTFWSFWMVFTALGLLLGPAIPAEWRIGFAAPALFMALLVTAVDHWQKAFVAAVAGTVTLAFAGLPNRLGLLIGALAGIGLGLFIEWRRR